MSEFQVWNIRHSIIGNYEIIEILGVGAFGIVYKARHIPTNHFVAIKTIHQEELKAYHDIELFLQEIQTTISLHHPLIAEVFDFFESNSKFYVVLEYCSHENLHSLIRKQKCIHESKAKQIFLQLISALEYLHNEKHIAHRDLKADNIMFDEYDNIRLIDFGFSKKFSSRKAIFSTKCGSYFYQAPEIIQGQKYDQRCDIWSAGVLLYFMIHGNFPFTGNENLLILKILKAEPEYPESFSSDLIDLISCMLKKDPKDRISLSGIKKHPWFHDFEYKMLLETELNRHFYEKSNIDQHIITCVKSFGIDCKNLIQNLSNNIIGSDTTTYQLLCREKMTKSLKCLKYNEENHPIRMWQRIIMNNKKIQQSKSQPFLTLKNSENSWFNLTRTNRRNFSPRNNNVFLHSSNAPILKSAFSVIIQISGEDSNKDNNP